MRIFRTDDWSIRVKLPIIVMGFGTISALVVAYIAGAIAETALQAAANERLNSIATSRRVEIERYLTSIEQDLLVAAASPTIAEALSEFSDAFGAVGQDPLSVLQKAYITDNPNPLGEKYKLIAANDPSNYTAAHKKFHPSFLTLQQQRECYDVFLISPKGDVVYSVFKELDFASSVHTGRWARTDFSGLIREALTGRRGEIFFVDFAPYEPSNDVPASFIATPVFNGSGALAGVVAFQMPIGRLNAIVQQAAGLGESGDVWIVGEDNLARSDSRFAKETTILSAKVSGSDVQSALTGKQGVTTISVEGQDVVSAYGAVEFNGVEFAVVARENLDEIAQPANDLIWSIIQLT